MELDAEHVRNLPPKADFSATIKGKEYDKRADAAQALSAALTDVEYDPIPTDPTPLGVFKDFAIGGTNTGLGYRLVIARPETQQPYETGHIQKEDITAAGLMSRLDNLVKGIPNRAEQIRERMALGQDSLGLYAEQLRKQFEGAGELEHAERQLRVIQARLSDHLEDLPKGDDPEMDVDAEYVASADGTPREAPDADAIDLGEAVEAVRSPRRGGYSQRSQRCTSG